MARLRFNLLAAMAAACLAGAAWACDIPVFRYALERWPAEPYRVTLFHRGPWSAAEKPAADLLDAVERGGLVNLEVEAVDLAGKVSPEAQELWAAQKDARLPWLVVQYPPDRRGDTKAAWAGPLDVATAEKLVDSPARRQIAQRLLAGESAVWVVLESGDARRDAAAAQKLQAMLEEQEKTIELIRPDPDAPGPRLRSDVPLRLAFPVLRVSRRDPAEALFVALLSGIDPAAADAKEPVAVPVFGRGRALGLLPAPAMSEQTVADGCAFMAGACSCQVKEQNPGTDLLLAADWDALLENRPARALMLPAVAASAVPALPGAGAGALYRNLALAGGAALVLLVVGTWTVLARSRRNGRGIATDAHR